MICYHCLGDKMKELSKKQKDVLTVIKKNIATKGYPPTVREIGKKLNLSSPATVQYYIELLEKKGYIKKDNSKTRTIEVLTENEFIKKEVINVSLISTEDTNPIDKINNKENEISVPSSLISNKGFLLINKTDKMTKYGINKNDLLLIDKVNIKENDIIATLVDNKINLSRYSKDKSNETVLGKVIGLYRSLK